MATSYRWHPGRRPRRQLRRIAEGEVDAALAAFSLDDRHETVHIVRQHAKRLRALLRLVRGSAPDLARRESHAIRDTARRLAGLRDAAVAMETFDALAAEAGELAGSVALAGPDAGPAAASDPTPGADAAGEWVAVRQGLLERRAEHVVDELEPALTVVRTELEALRGRVGSWEVDGAGFDVIVVGLGRAHERCRNRMVAALDAPTIDAFHRWRKAAKDHRYHLELLHEIWPVVLGAQEDELHRLTDLLGQEHDLAVLRAWLHAEPDRFGGQVAVGVVTGVLDRLRARRQREAFVLGRRCTAEPSAAFVDRLRRGWDVAVAEREGPRARGDRPHAPDGAEVI
jgi:CHAD domain-containing protein